MYQSNSIVLTSFPRSYYVKAGFYMGFGWLWASAVLWLCLCLVFVALMAIGLISTGFLHNGLVGGLRG